MQLKPCSASLNRRSENVVVEPIIVPELELRNVKMQVFLCSRYGRCDDPAFEDAPETLNRVSVHCTDNETAHRTAQSAAGSEPLEALA
jgi:hypothetical protein